MKTNNDKVREFLKKGNPHFDGEDAHQCYQKCWAASGLIEISLPEFIDGMRLSHMVPDIIRPGLYRLALPTSPSR